MQVSSPRQWWWWWWWWTADDICHHHHHHRRGCIALLPLHITTTTHNSSSSRYHASWHTLCPRRHGLSGMQVPDTGRQPALRCDNFFSFHDLVVLPRLLCERHARTQIKGKKKKQRFGYVHGMHSTTKSSSVRHGCCRLAGLGWAELAQKEKIKEIPPDPTTTILQHTNSIPDAMGLLSCPTHYAGAAFPRSLRRF